MESNEKGKDVLIVEDSLTQAEKLKFFLEMNEYHAFTAANGNEALPVMRKRRPSIVITDIIMPEMNGYELCRSIKRDESLKDIPVILLTALSDPADILKGLECGADNFISKPYDEKYLLARIQHLLGDRTAGKMGQEAEVMEISYGNHVYHIKMQSRRILDLLISTYETVILKNAELQKAHEELRKLNVELEKWVHDRTQELAAKNEELRKDIIERKEAELKYRSIFENAVEGIFTTDLAWHVLSVNPAFARMLGYNSPEEFIMRVSDITKIYIDPDQRNEIIDIIRKNGTVIDFEVRYRCKNGKEIYCSLSGHGVFDPGRKLVGLEGMVLDITERKGAQDALIQTNRVLETIFEHSNILFAYLDANFNFIKVNRSFAKADDREPSFFPGKNHFELYPDPENEKTFRSVVESKEPYMELSRKFVYPDHPERGVSYWDLSLVPINDARSNVTGLILALQNVTKRKIAEEELQKLNTELDLRVKERTAEIEKKKAELERFNKLFVGRELRMIELKNEIARLEKELDAMKGSDGVR